MSKLLISEPPLTVLPSLAVIVGLNEAIVLQQIHYWINQKEESGNNYINGRHWVYNSYSQWQKQFPFWSASTLRRIIAKLESDGLLITGNHNKTAFDKTKWYTINYDELERRRTEYEQTQEADAV